jgi:anti-sigma B factor antagonist
MEVTCTREGSSARFAVVGDVDSETSPRLEAAIADAVKAGARHLVVDPSGISFLSSSGLTTLIGAHRNADSFQLERGNRIVDRLISLTGLTMLYGTNES